MLRISRRNRLPDITYSKGRWDEGSFHPSVPSSIRPSKFLIPEEEDDGRGVGGGQMWQQQVIQMFM